MIARNSSFTYKGRALDVKQVGRELGVRYVLEGSVRKAGARVRVTAQLIEAATGGHLWAERYDRDLSDIFAVQDEITASVSAAILPSVERNERERAARKPPDSLDAWETYHRGMWHVFKVNAGDNQRARELFERTLQIDPGLATAWGGLALTSLMDGWLYRATENRASTVSTASDCAHKCLALDPSDAVGHFVLATALLMLGRHAEGTAEAELCVTHNPNHAWGYAVLGGIRAFGGRPAEAFEPLENALRLSPFDPLEYFWRHWISRAHYWSGDYEAAAVVARRVWRSHLQVHAAARTLIAALGQLGRRDEAHKVVAELIKQFGETHFREILVLHPAETRDEDHRHLLDGYRKAGALADG